MHSPVLCMVVDLKANKQKELTFKEQITVLIFWGRKEFGAKTFQRIFK